MKNDRCDFSNMLNLLLALMTIFNPKHFKLVVVDFPHLHVDRMKKDGELPKPKTQSGFHCTWKLHIWSWRRSQTDDHNYEYCFIRGIFMWYDLRIFQWFSHGVVENELSDRRRSPFYISTRVDRDYSSKMCFLLILNALLDITYRNPTHATRYSFSVR